MISSLKNLNMLHSNRRFIIWKSSRGISILSSNKSPSIKTLNLQLPMTSSSLQPRSPTITLLHVQFILL
ncbi:hypothetical protein LINGRAHAP2_LOCUS24628 [Linum grandiflorum]